MSVSKPAGCVRQGITAALLTPRGRGAVATIRVQGPEFDQESRWQHFFRAVNNKPLEVQPLRRVVFGHWGDVLVEEIVVCRIDERCVEIHCHGGEAAARRILADLERAGATLQHWQQMLAHTDGSFAAECTEALTRATTFRTATILLEQHSGVLRAAIEQILAEPFDCQRAATSISQLLRWSEFGLHLTRPWEVVLTGRPNVGKSSLVNTLVGYARSIVFAEPGTTRDVVTAETAFDGWPILFADTAGIRESTDALETAGIDRAQRKLREADCRVLLLDTSRPPQSDDFELLNQWPDAVVVAHKCDLSNTWGDRLPAGALHVSSVTGEGVDELARIIVDRLIPEVPPARTPVPVSTRQIELLEQAYDAANSADESAFRNRLKSLIDL